MVPANGRWCRVAGKVTVGLASHWPRITGISGSPHMGSRPRRGKWAPACTVMEHGWLRLKLVIVVLPSDTREQPRPVPCRCRWRSVLPAEFNDWTVEAGSPHEQQCGGGDYSSARHQEWTSYSVPFIHSTRLLRQLHHHHHHHHHQRIVFGDRSVPLSMATMNGGIPVSARWHSSIIRRGPCFPGTTWQSIPAGTRIPSLPAIFPGEPGSAGFIEAKDDRKNWLIRVHLEKWPLKWRECELMWR